MDNRLWSAQYDPETDVVSGLYAVDLETIDVVDKFPLEEIDSPGGVYAFESIWLQSGGTVFRIPADALAG